MKAIQIYQQKQVGLQLLIQALLVDFPKEGRQCGVKGNKVH